jgi:hypothetical protein
MSNVKLLDGYWRDLILDFEGNQKLDSALVICYPKAPFFAINHVADTQTSHDKAPSCSEKQKPCLPQKKFPL